MDTALRASEPVPTGLARCLAAAISFAQARLRGPGVTDADIHELRKNLKCARAILRLLRPALSGQAFRSTDTELQDIGRSWAALRDARVQRDSLMAVKQAADDADIEACVDFLLEALPAIVAEADRDAHAARDLAVLARVQRRIRGWRLTDPEGLIPGESLRRTYRAGRRAAERAQRRYGDEDFHVWRRLAKYLYYQLQTLAPERHEELDALIDRLDRLGDLIGKDHDLAALEVALAAEGLLDGLPGEGRCLLQWIGQARTELRSRAVALGAEAYALKPREFEERVRRGWRPG